MVCGYNKQVCLTNAKSEMMLSTYPDPMKDIVSTSITKKVITFSFILIIADCSSHKANQVPKQFRKLKNLTVYPADTKSQKNISFNKDVVYGGSKKVTIGQIGAIAVDSSGRVFIVDSQKMTIDVFEPDSQFLTQFGSNGRGPVNLCV
ncbi:MAG TPA: hypothetical protein VKA34_15925 [Balneolales bacterium]|nr:hypothetical protein [Balneolales bacterium]